MFDYRIWSQMLRILDHLTVWNPNSRFNCWATGFRNLARTMTLTHIFTQKKNGTSSISCDKNVKRHKVDILGFKFWLLRLRAKYFAWWYHFVPCEPITYSNSLGKKILLRFWTGPEWSVFASPCFIFTCIFHKMLWFLGLWTRQSFQSFFCCWGCRGSLCFSTRPPTFCSQKSGFHIV